MNKHRIYKTLLLRKVYSWSNICVNVRDADGNEVAATDKDASIIKAAPAMLAALKTVEWKVWDAEANGTAGAFCCPYCHALQGGPHADLCIVAAAIAKAEEGDK